MGDTIQFIKRNSTGDYLKTEVVALHQFDSFSDLFTTELFSKCGFGNLTPEEAVGCMRKYYSKEKEQRFGVIGIFFIIKL